MIISQALWSHSFFFLEAEDPEKDISLYINSPGGVITSGYAIYDTMQYIKPDVATLCVGQAASMGAFLLAAGAKGKTFRASQLPHHDSPALRRVPGDRRSDIEIQAREVQKMKANINAILAERTGKSIETVAKDSDRDYFMSASECLEYGLIDKILERK